MSPTRTSSVPNPRNTRPGHDRLDRLRRRILWHRRWWAAGLAAAAVFTAVQALRPAEPETVNVLVAARDLPGGRTLEQSDVQSVTYPADAAPAGALSAQQPPTGRELVAPVRAGTPLTDRSLLGRPLLRSLAADTVAAPARITDPELLSLIQVGDRVDVVAGASGEAYPAEATSQEWSPHGQARVIARSVRVLAIPDQDTDDGPLTGSTGELVLLAVTPETAIELAGSDTGSELSLILHGPGS